MYMKSRFITSLILVLFSIHYLSSQEPTRWRGPEANGHYPDKGLLKQWPQNGPEILWSFEELGEGHSSPAIAGGYIYLPTMFKGMGHMFKLSMDGN